jgi:hypothetical protein
MNSIKCPQCGLVNWGAPPACKRCGLSFQDLGPQAFVSVPAGEHVYAPGFPAGAMGAQETEQTRKTWKWFVTYCVLLVALDLFVALLGVGLLIVGQQSPDSRADEMTVQGIIFIVFGLALTVPYALGPFVKGKSWGWIYGILLIAFGMMSCCYWPITIPLMIQWVKPEMKRMFGPS